MSATALTKVQSKDFAYLGDQSGYATWEITQDTLGYYHYFKMLNDAKFKQEHYFECEGTASFKIYVESKRKVDKKDLETQLALASEREDLRQFATAIHTYQQSSYCDSKTLQLFQQLFNKIVLETKSGTAHESNSVAIKHMTLLANTLATKEVTAPEMTAFGKNFDLALYGKKPLSPAVKSLICGIIGAVVGLVAGLIVGAVVTGYAGGFGAIPGMLLGAAVGSKIGIAVGAVGLAAGLASAGCGLFSSTKNTNKFNDKVTATSSETINDSHNLIESISSKLQA